MNHTSTPQKPQHFHPAELLIADEGPIDAKKTAEETKTEQQTHPQQTRSSSKMEGSKTGETIPVPPEHKTKLEQQETISMQKRPMHK